MRADDVPPKNHYSKGGSGRNQNLTMTDLQSTTDWVAWCGEPDPNAPRRLRKVPYKPATGGKATGPHSTWGGTYKAAKALRKRLRDRFPDGGVGIVLGNGLLGVDLDGCRDPDTGMIAKWARRVINRFATYTEISPSGTGVKLFMRCTESDLARIVEGMGGKHGRNFKGKPKGGKAPGIEAYAGERYFTMTGDVLDDSPDELALVTADEFLWVVDIAGPEFMGGAESGSATGEGWQDESGSGVGWRHAVETARHGKFDLEDFKAVLAKSDDPDVERWREDERQVKRTWANAVEKVQKEDEERERDILEKFDLLPPLLSPVDSLNRKHALVMIEGKAVVVTNKNDGSFAFGSVADLHHYYANHRVVLPKSRGKVVPISEAWMQSENRQSYPNGVAFDPSGRAGHRTLNLWTGWKVEPNPHASCKLFLNHLRKVVCRGDEESYRYLVGWCADMVQNAGRKPGVAVVMRGGQGAGKDTVAEYLARMIGQRHSPVLGHSEQLVSRFNSDMEAALLLRIEEAWWAGDKKGEGYLKHLVTSPVVTIERKGIDRIAFPSVTRIFMSSNAEWVVPASFDARRWAVFNVSNSRIGNTAYFKALRAEMDGEGPAALLHFLQGHDLTDFNVNIPPATEGLGEQKIASLNDFNRFWFDTLHRGHLPGAVEWRIRIGCTDLADNYNQYAKEDRHRANYMDERMIGKALSKMCPAVDRKQGKRPERAWQYRIPELNECRQMFEKCVGATIEWGDSDD